MSSRAGELAARRSALLARSALLRERLVIEGQTIESALSFVDRGVAIARSGALQPVFTLAAALLVVLRPRLLWTLASRSVALWPVARRIVPSVWKRLTGARAARRERAALAASAPAEPGDS